MRYILAVLLIFNIIGCALPFLTSDQSRSEVKNSITRTAASSSTSQITITNADSKGLPTSRFDIDGNALDAHDGGIYRFEDRFYLYGTSYACGYQYQVNSNFCGFKVYSSADLVHWKNEGFAVPPSNCRYCFRPHVMYNALNKNYVMWADAGGTYQVFTSPSPTGPFQRQGDPKIAVGNAVDETLFQDDDGTGWLIHNTTQKPVPCCDMVVEKLTPDYLNTTGEFVRVGLGDVEAFAVFKRHGVYHALMSDPSCAYCSGSTGELTATSMLGPWSGKWYDPEGINQKGESEPRWRSRIVNSDSCGGQPLVVLPISERNGSTGYYFISDRWNNRSPNESLANFFIGPLAFDQSGVLQNFDCVRSFQISINNAQQEDYTKSPDLDQHSGFDGFHHYCDISGKVQRQQSFTPSKSGQLAALTVTTFRSGLPSKPLIIDILDRSGKIVYSNTVPAENLTWAPQVFKIEPNINVNKDETYVFRLRTSSSKKGTCYGFEYNDENPYAGGEESYSTNDGKKFTAEGNRDIKFTTDIKK